MLSVAVYWINPIEPNTHFCKVFSDIDGDNIGLALTLMQDLRGQGCTHVCYASENTDMVGKSGVNAVVDGKLPDGSDYTWKKRRK